MTYDQKFILLLKTDSFFKKECQYMIKEWGLPKTKEIASAKESELPIQYKKDIRFILLQSKLPLRYFSHVHKYLLTGVIPTLKELPPRARVFVSLIEEDKMGKVIIEIDPDAGKKEILATLKDVAEMKKMMQKINEVGTKSQPMRNFMESLKIMTDPNEIFEIAEKYYSKRNAGKKVLTTRHRLEAKLRRNKKLLSGHRRISVRNREEYEKRLKKYDADSDW